MHEKEEKTLCIKRGLLEALSEVDIDEVMRECLDLIMWETYGANQASVGMYLESFHEMTGITECKIVI